MTTGEMVLMSTIGAPCAEATVTVRADGTGGPNQEFALTVELGGVEGRDALGADTRGNDGPTHAAGGLATGSTAGEIRAAWTSKRRWRTTPPMPP